MLDACLYSGPEARLIKRSGLPFDQVYKARDGDESAREQIKKLADAVKSVDGERRSRDPRVRVAKLVQTTRQVSDLFKHRDALIIQLLLQWCPQRKNLEPEFCSHALCCFTDQASVHFLRWYFGRLGPKPPDADPLRADVTPDNLRQAVAKLEVPAFKKIRTRLGLEKDKPILFHKTEIRGGALALVPIPRYLAK